MASGRSRNERSSAWRDPLTTSDPRTTSAMATASRNPAAICA
jgi:hypothetical protein